MHLKTKTKHSYCPKRCNIQTQQSKTNANLNFQERERVQFSSVQFKMGSMRSENPANTAPRLWEMSLTLPLKQFQCSSDWRWPSLALSRKIVQRFLFFGASLFLAIDDVMFLALCLQVVSSSSIRPIFRDPNHLRWLLCPPVYLSAWLFPFTPAKEGEADRDAERQRDRQTETERKRDRERLRFIGFIVYKCLNLLTMQQEHIRYNWHIKYECH